MFGVCGACWAYELTNVRTDHVKDYGTEIIVQFPDSKWPKVAEQYAITGAVAEIVRKYMKLRPAKMTTNRFFVNYREGKCTVQAIGKHTIARVPKKIAEFLELPSPEGYTGNSFKRSSPTILAETGTGIMRHGVMKSFSVAAGKMVIKYELCTDL